MGQLHLREWTQPTTRREGWGSGAWDGEADKVQWVDEASNLDCLIVRGPLGALCGYVGVPEGHPSFEKGYDDVEASVHGGLTFAGFCHEPTREAWEKWRARFPSLEQEAVKYPRGDAARELRTKGHLRDDYDAWKAWGESAFICHVPVEGRPAHVWWLGFDCSHYGDLTPGMYEHRESLGISRDEIYRTRRYVEQEVASLAQQLAGI